MDHIDGPDPLVVHSRFSTTDTDLAEHFLRSNYADATITIAAAGGFGFDHSMAAAPGFSSNTLLLGVEWTSDVVTRAGDAFVVVQPVQGRVAHVDSAYPDVHAGTGDVCLLPPDSPVRTVCQSHELAVVQLDRSAVLDYAAATTGVDPDHLAFRALTPSTPALGRFLQSTTAHVRAHVLADQWATRSPIVLGQAFRWLAAALLSTFPNTALARTADPESPSVRGEVSEATLREVVDFLESHADEPIGPTDVAAVADVPAGEIVEGLRRRRGVHPAELLWHARLRGVRRSLVDADPATARLPALAARWGFPHLGRFRVAYVQEFDETPEQTLRR